MELLTTAVERAFMKETIAWSLHELLYNSLYAVR